MMRSISVVVFLSLAVPAHAWCWRAAGARYGIDPRLLWSIAKVESGMDPQAINRNTDGSIDIGLMQINSRHLAELGYSQQTLIANPCASVMAGAWVLGGMIRKYGYTWRAVGAYNAGVGNAREAGRARYARKVWQTWLDLRNQQAAY